MWKTNRKIVLLAGATAVAFAMGASGVLAAEKKAKVVNSRTDKVKVSVSGQFSKGVLFSDEGAGMRTRITDINFSQSRFIVKATGKITKELSVSSQWVASIDDNRDIVDNAANGFGGRAAGDVRTRNAEMWFNHTQFGRVYLGSGSTAADGVMNTNTHGAMEFLPGFPSLVGVMQFRHSADNTLTGITLQNVFTDLDFASREPRIRYNTPTVFGLQLALSYSDDSNAEVALRYGGKFFDTKLKAAAGYGAGGAGANNADNYGGMIAAEHSSGIGFGIGYGWQNPRSPTVVGGNATLSTTDADNTVFHVQPYFKRKFTEMGSSAVLFEYQQSVNQALDSDKGTMWSVGAHQWVDAAALEFFVKYSNFDLDRPSTSLGAVDDIDTVLVGTRLKF